MFSRKNTLAKVDAELWSAIEAENRRQEEHIELIASENYVSQAVLEAQGSQLTNKYAEGYPGKRYYGGCEHVDVAEQLASTARRNSSAPTAPTCSPNSGSQANQAVFFAFLKPGDTILGMNLSMGGHLTTACRSTSAANGSTSCPMPRQERGDRLRRDERLAARHKPKLIIAGLPPTPCASTSSASPRWRRKLAPSSWWTWRTTPA